MQEAHIIYNENAGGNNGPSVEEIQKALQESGFSATYTVTENQEEVDEVLEKVEGIVVAVGGDGTVGAILNRLIGKDIPVIIVPMGTANNIALSMNISLDPLQHIAALKNSRPTPFDVGLLQAPWGEEYFFEGAGFGFFADVLAIYDPDRGKSIWRGMEAIGNYLLKNDGAYHSRLFLNGEELADNYLLVEVMNTPAIGPRLKLAPQAAANDGLLDLVCVKADKREGLLAYFKSLLLEELGELETVTTRQVQEVSFQWNGFPIHLDGEVRPPGWKEKQAGQETTEETRPSPPPIESAEIKVKILPGALSLWLPVANEAAV